MISDKAIAIIKHYEGIHDGDLKTVGLQPKACPVGIWTVGYGRALTDPKSGRFLKGTADKALALSLYPSLTEKEATEMLHQDLSRFESTVRRLVKVKINEEQMGACVSLCYNIGVGNFNKSSVLRHINNSKFDLAAAAFLLWNKGNIDADPELEVLPGLTFRRKSERHLFLHGEVVIFNN